jgi:hypothetical protein
MDRYPSRASRWLAGWLECNNLNERGEVEQGRQPIGVTNCQQWSSTPRTQNSPLWQNEKLLWFCLKEYVGREDTICTSWFPVLAFRICCRLYFARDEDCYYGSMYRSLPHMSFFLVSASLFKYIKAAFRPGLMRGVALCSSLVKMKRWIQLTNV